MTSTNTATTDVKDKVSDSPVKDTKRATSAKTVKQKTVAATERKVFDASEPIMCTSITAGELIMIGKKTKNVYKWAEYGDRTEIEYQDLQSAKLTKSQYIYSPLIMIDNEELLNTWPDVQNVYNKAMSAGEDITELFNLDNPTFERVLKGLPVGIKNTIKTMAYSMVEDGTLDSLRKIRIIDEVLGTDIMTLIRE